MDTYEKKYNEAMLRADEAVQKGCLDKAIFDEIFPPEESEDEKIRKDLIYDIERLPMQGVLTHRPTSEYISYLEKQEQKPVSTEDMPYITDEHFYEREPADSFKYKLAEYMTKCCTKKEGPYGYTYGISAESILKMAEEELLKRGVVQKPAEWSEEQMMKDAVKWLVDDDYHEATEKGRFILGSVGIGYNGYYIPYSDLLKLPKEDEK